MFKDLTPDGIQVIQHRATSIRHQPGKDNSPVHTYKHSSIDFMQCQGISLFRKYLKFAHMPPRMANIPQKSGFDKIPVIVGSLTGIK